MKILKRLSAGPFKKIAAFCRPDGKVEVEENGEVTKQEAASAAGFVVDTQPDLRVSRVLPWLLLGRCFILFFA